MPANIAKVRTEELHGFDVVDFVIRFESGDMDEDEIIEGFQHLIDDGTVWSLQGVYGRTAQALIEGGACTAPSA